MACVYATAALASMSPLLPAANHDGVDIDTRTTLNLPFTHTTHHFLSRVLVHI